MDFHAKDCGHPHRKVGFPVFLLPGIFMPSPWRIWLAKKTGYLNILPKFITWKVVISGTWRPKTFGCITYSKVRLCRIFTGNPMALHIRNLCVHSDFVSTSFSRAQRPPNCSGSHLNPLTFNLVICMGCFAPLPCSFWFWEFPEPCQGRDRSRRVPQQTH